MRAADIKKLDKVAELYGKIADLLESVHEHTLEDPDEWMPVKNPTKVSSYIGNELSDVRSMNEWFVRKLQIIKEMQNDSKEAL